MKDTADFAMGQAALLVEIDDGCLGIGSELGSGGTQGVGSLQRMAALNPALALPTTADMHVELAVNRPAWNLDLVLVIDAGFLDGSAAVRASLGKRRLIGFIDLLGRLAMRLGAVILAGLASGLFRLGLGWPLGEGSRLALAGAPLLIEEACQLLHLSAQFGDLALELRDLAFEANTVEAW